jgi:urea transporter
MKRQLEFILDMVFFSYSQIFFCRNRWLALLFILATFAVHPLVGLSGISGAVLANLYAYLFGLDREKIRSGYYGYNAVLLSLGLGYYVGLSFASFLLLGLAVFVVLILTTSLENILGYYFNLPVLALPFVLTMTLIFLSAHFFPGLSLITAPAGGMAISPDTAGLTDLYFRSLGSIFFQNSALSGLLIFAGLLFYSRLTVILSLIGFAAGLLLCCLPGGGIGQTLPIGLGFNAILTAVVLGGIYCLPSFASFLLAAAAALVSAFIYYAFCGLSSQSGVPILIFPFVLTTLLFLTALRTRADQKKPLLTVYQVGNPEENLLYAIGLEKKSGPQLAVRFDLPFQGSWVVSQGAAGRFTHRDRYVQALDFWMMDRQGRTARRESKQPADFYAYGQPVCAPAAGTVVKVVEGVFDNPIGEINAEQNWGNLVIINHAWGVYSLLAHLACYSVKVTEGQTVRAGEVVALCGNSGRSPQPHLHFQVQYSKEIGAAAVFYPFASYLLELQGREGRQLLIENSVPREGERVLNIAPDEKVSRALAFPLGESYLFDVESGAGRTEEKWTVNVDYYGKYYLRSEPGGDTLYFAKNHHTFTVYDYHGSRRSALFAFFLGASRVPLGYGPDLDWQDKLPVRLFLSRAQRFFTELFFPFFEIARISSRLRYDEPEKRSEQLFPPSCFAVTARICLSFFARSTTAAERLLNKDPGRTIWRVSTLLDPGSGPLEIEAKGQRGNVIRARRKPWREYNGPH